MPHLNDFISSRKLFLDEASQRGRHGADVLMMFRRYEFHTRIEGVMRRSIASILQLLGLIVTAESLVLYFGDMGPMMITATLGAGLFYAGHFIRPQKGQ